MALNMGAVSSPGCSISTYLFADGLEKPKDSPSALGPCTYTGNPREASSYSQVLNFRIWDTLLPPDWQALAGQHQYGAQL